MKTRPVPATELTDHCVSFIKFRTNFAYLASPHSREHKFVLTIFEYKPKTFIRSNHYEEDYQWQTVQH